MSVWARCGVGRRVTGAPSIAACLAIWLAASAVNGQGLNELLRQFERLQNAGRYRESEAVAEIMLRSVGQNDRAASLAIASDCMAASLVAQERFGEAERYCLRALKHFPDNESGRSLAIVAYERLAGIYVSQSKFREAVETYRVYLSRLENKEGPSSQRLVAPLVEMADIFIRQTRYEEAERNLQRAKAICVSEQRPNSYLLAGIARTMGRMRVQQFQYASALPFYQEALAGYERANDQRQVSVSLMDLALLANSQGRYPEMEQFARRSLELTRKRYGPDHTRFAHCEHLLGLALANQGRYAEAEPLMRRALEVRRRTLGPVHSLISISLYQLASLCVAQSRNAEAMEMLKESIAIDEQVWGPNHYHLAPDLGLLADLYFFADEYERAETLYHRIREIFGVDSPECGPCLSGLGWLAVFQEEFDKAEALFHESLELYERFERDKGFRFPQQRSRSLDGLGRVYRLTGRHREADETLTQVIRLEEQAGASSSDLGRSYWQRGLNSWAMGRNEAAAADLRKAMELVEQGRSQFSGNDPQRAGSFIKLTAIFDAEVRFQLETGGPDGVAAILNAMERGRNRSLIDQMAARGIDLLAGLPAEQRAALERRQTEAGSRIASIESQLEALRDDETKSAEVRRAALAPLYVELVEAQKEFVAVAAEYRNASPAFRLAVGKNHQPIQLEALQEFVAAEHGVLLRYYLNDRYAYALVISEAAAPRVVELTVTPEMAPTLGVAPGSLNQSKLARLMRSEDGEGVLQLLRKSQNPEIERAAAAKLAALWQLLIPVEEREALLSGDVKRLMVAPDHDLAMLPFEALVVEQTAGETKYLLDAGPPIVYAPSATILWNLARRPAAVQRESGDVLTVGDPAYGRDAAGDRAAPLARYRAAGGKLSRLPYSATEASWVEQVFVKSGLAVSRLVGASATEAAVRARIPGRRVVHFACHGLVDQKHGNMFGALALASQIGAVSSSRDDGFLTLAEIYQLDLSNCELAILSACDTNVGPTQVGEGVWALSRGFLVAGSRRTVSSNWVVDDKAAASQISYFSSLIARAHAAGRPPDYAASLQRARRWVRQQEPWRSPYYWATFVLVGPG